jgi:ankyrin repeat protein
MELLHDHSDIDTHDEYGNTPFFCAAVEGELDVKQVLLRHGASVDPRDDDGWTPL